VVHEYPENMINSVAVYPEDQKFRGKAFHIPRLKVTDSEGSWEWLDVDVDLVNKEMKITVSDSFINNAVYPITIDPEFGYTTLGAAAYTISGNDMIGIRGTPAGYGMATDLFAGLDSTWVAGEYAKMALYTVGGSLVKGSEERQGTGTTGAHWEGFTIPAGKWISAQEYTIQFWTDSSCQIYRDTGGTNESKYATETYNGFPASVTFSDSNNFYSTYASYIAKGASVFWGISATSYYSSVDHTNIRHMGGTSPDIDWMVINGVRYYTDGIGTLAEAVYIGGDLDDPTNGASQISEVHNQTTVSGWNVYSVPDYIWDKGVVTWIGVAKSTGISSYYQDEVAEAEDFQTARGRWSQTTPTDHDETTALPSTIGAGTFSDWWYGYALRFYIGITGSISATLEETTMTATGKKVISGSMNVTLEETAFSATAKRMIEGSISVDLEESTMDSAGGGAAGSITASLEETELSAAGKKTISGSMNITLEETTIAAAGGKFIDGNISTTLEETTFSADGIRGIAGSIIQTLEEAAISAAGYVFAKITGTMAVTLEETTMAAQGGGAQGSINTTLEETQIVFSGEKIIEGDINITLEEATMDASGGGAQGSISADLEETEFSASGFAAQKITGIISVTLEETSMDASGDKMISGSISQELPETFMGALGYVYERITGSMDVTLDDPEFLFFGFAAQKITGSMDVQNPAVVMDGQGVIPAVGTIDAILEEAVMEAYGLNTAESFPSELMKVAIVKWLEYIYNRAKINFNGIIWEDQNAPRPADPYISVRWNAFGRIGQDYRGRPNPDGYGAIIGNREFTLSIQCHGEKSIERLEVVRNALNWSEANNILKIGRLVVVDDLQIVNVPDLHDTKWKQRGVLDILMRAAAETYDQIGVIESADLEGKFYIDNQEVKSQIFTIP
ncbi:MAG: hypothetical protein KAU20_07615, partial [Nanoarchaeota archaeon]|nr:hypothetical protein [Nanoarchaeota archaeon]